MDNMTGLSASDVALLGRNGDGNGMTSFFWVFALLLLANGGFGTRGDYGQYATAASQQEILFGQHFQDLDNKIDRLGNGIADATFALNNSIKDGNAMVAGRVVDEGRAMQSQLATCCCENQKNTDALRYDMATMFATSNANTTAQIQSLKDTIAQNKIEALQAQVSELKTQNMFCGIPRINPYGYNVVPTSTGCGCPCANV